VRKSQTPTKPSLPANHPREPRSLGRGRVPAVDNVANVPRRAWIEGNDVRPEMLTEIALLSPRALLRLGCFVIEEFRGHCPGAPQTDALGRCIDQTGQGGAAMTQKIAEASLLAVTIADNVCLLKLAFGGLSLSRDLLASWPSQRSPARPWTTPRTSPTSWISSWWRTENTQRDPCRTEAAAARPDLSLTDSTSVFRPGRAAFDPFADAVDTGDGSRITDRWLTGEHVR